MKIVVCVKRVGCIYHPSAVDLNIGGINAEKMVFMLNPFDEAAVEAALCIKEAVDDCEISLVTAGGAGAVQALRSAAAMGGPKIDRLIRVDTPASGNLDAWRTSLVLAEAIRPIQADLILCGKKAIDTNDGQVGACLAEHLDLPQVSGIVALEFTDSGERAIVHRDMGRGDRMEIFCDLPAVFTVDTGLNDPRYPRMQDRFFAASMPIAVIAPDGSGTESTTTTALIRIEGFSFPRPKTRKVFTPDSNLSVMDRMNAILMGGGGAKKEGGSILEGDDDELAGYLFDFLCENNIINIEDA
jgi:electron transfer flavoprotein beta subunit